MNGYNSTITVEFDPPIYWVAIDMPECEVLFLYSEDQLLLQTDGCLGEFVGAGSSSMVDKVVIYDGAGCPCIDDLHFSRTPVTIDCNRNGVADLLELTPECALAVDCNGNMVPDECDIESGDSGDCNETGVPDECEVSQWQILSDAYAPFGDPITSTFTFSAPPAGSDVSLTLSVSGDLDEPLEFISWVRVDDYIVDELLLIEDGLHCAEPPQHVHLTVPAAVFNGLVEPDGEVVVRVSPSSAVDRTECPEGFLAVELGYFTYAAADLDFDGIPDACEGPPGDVDGDGDVDFSDLLELISAWGDCVPAEHCPADADLSGSVGFTDLLLLLSNWT